MLRVIDKLALPLAVLTCIMLAIAFGMVFFYAPVEMTMGIAQKIFYVHVPSAFAMYAGFVCCAVASLAYLFKPRQELDVIARSGAEIGLIFGLFVMISGPLWAYKAWGTFWVWDAQLTATFVLFMLYLGYAMLRALSPPSRSIRMLSAVLGSMSSIVIPFIHYAVKYWGGLHPVVQREGGGGLQKEMLYTFGVSTLAMLLLFTCLLIMLVRMRQTSLEIDRLYLEFADMERASTLS